MANYNVFKLYDYGCGMNLIEPLISNKINPYDIFINKNKALKNIETSDNKKQKIIQCVEDMIENEDTERTIYELLYQNISKGVCDSLYKNKITIELLKNIDNKEAKEKYNIGNAMLERLKQAIYNNDEIIKNFSYSINTLDVLRNELKKHNINNPITIFDLENIMFQKKDYIISNYMDDLQKLQENNEVLYSSFGIYYSNIKVIDFLQKNYEDRRYQIIYNRLSGKNLREIGEMYDITRERVRQICSKIENKIIEKDFYEDKYQAVFEKYNWDCESFMNVFDEAEITYYYLNLKYKKGNVDLINIINDDLFTSEQKEKINQEKNVVLDSDGNILKDSNDFLRMIVVKYAKESIHVDELSNIYNNELQKYPELCLKKITGRNLEGKLSRSDYAFFGSNHMVRYYEFADLNDESIEQLKELILLSDGFYSTDYLFKNNSKLMKELDIRDSSELHNILKLKIDDEENNVYFIRMPNFLVEYHDKESFILDKIREYSPISINDLVNILYEDYGHKKNTMYSYLISEFNVYINNGYFSIESVKLDEQSLNKIEKELDKDLYSVEEIKELLLTMNYENPVDMITNYNFQKIGYRMKSGFIIKKEYNGIYNYLEEMQKNAMIIKMSYSLCKCGSVYNALNYYCRELKLFKITDTVYITYLKLKELGMSMDYLLNFISEIEDKYQDTDYFSINNIIADFNTDMFSDLGFDEKFIENIISYRENVNTLRINNYKLFSFINKNLTRRKVIEDMISKYRSISLDELEDEISKNYQIQISVDKLKGYISETEIFYSKIMDKIYLDKNDYYEEVYDE